MFQSVKDWWRGSLGTGEIEYLPTPRQMFRQEGKKAVEVILPPSPPVLYLKIKI